MLELKENVLDTGTYLYLRKKVGWIKLTDKQAEQAVNNSLFTVCAYLDGKPVGMGRVIGDGAVISYIQDLVVIPEAQKKGIGRLIHIIIITDNRQIYEQNATFSCYRRASWSIQDRGQPLFERCIRSYSRQLVRR